VNLPSDDFELFGLARRFAHDRTQLEARWKDLQREAHPDKFAAQGGAAQRLAMQWSVRINEAYQRLKDPLKRAAYLCELHGVPVNAENNTAMPAAFLLQQMQWREALEEAAGIEDLDQIRLQVKQAGRNVLQKIEQLIDAQAAYNEAVGQVRAMMFIERFERDVDSRLDELEN